MAKVVGPTTTTASAYPGALSTSHILIAAIRAVRRRPLVALVLLPLVVACRKPVVAEMKQSDFTRARVRLYREKNGQRMYQANAVARVVVGNIESDATADSSGSIDVQIPDVMTTEIDFIDVTPHGGGTVRLPYRKRELWSVAQCEPKVLSFHHIGLRCRDTTKRELWTRSMCRRGTMRGIFIFK